MPFPKVQIGLRLGSKVSFYVKGKKKKKKKQVPGARLLVPRIFLALVRS